MALFRRVAVRVSAFHELQWSSDTINSSSRNSSDGAHATMIKHAAERARLTVTTTMVPAGFRTSTDSERSSETGFHVRLRHAFSTGQIARPAGTLFRDMTCLNCRLSKLPRGPQGRAICAPEKPETV